MDPDCPECLKAGIASTVLMHTAMGGRPVRPFVDDEGNAHLHEEEAIRVHWSCSNKHSWIETSACPCPVEGCTWTPGGGDAPMGTL